MMKIDDLKNVEDGIYVICRCGRLEDPRSMDIGSQVCGCGDFPVTHVLVKNGLVYGYCDYCRQYKLLYPVEIERKKNVFPIFKLHCGSCHPLEFTCVMCGHAMGEVETGGFEFGKCPKCGKELGTIAVRRMEDRKKRTTEQN